VISRRIVVNLVAFLVASTVLIVFGVVNLLGDPFDAPMDVSTVLPSADGLYTHFSVTLNGVDVGSVSSVGLTPAGAKVTMAIDPGVRIPGDVAAEIDVANPLGEQEIDLVPQRGGRGPDLRPGAVVPVAPGGAPADIGQVIATATTLLQSIPVQDLNTVLQQVAVALDGTAGDVQTLIESGRTFSQEFLAYQQQFEALLATAPPVLDAVTAAGPAVRDALANTATVLAVLSARQTDLLRLLASGGQTAQVADQIVVAERPNLACLVHDLGAVTTNLSEPVNLADLGTSLATNTQFFGVVDEVTPTGPARSLTSTTPGTDSQVWLRTHLLIPPVLDPSAVTYATQRTLPAVTPGAACDTEFGDGAAAASQPGFTPAGPGVQVEPASPAEAQVRGGGQAIAGVPLTTPVPSDPDPASPTGGPALPAMGAAAIVGPGVVHRARNRRQAVRRRSET